MIRSPRNKVAQTETCILSFPAIRGVWFSILTGTAFVLTGIVTAAWAHEEKKHRERDEKHVEAMYVIKRRIPQEYRDMPVPSHLDTEDSVAQSRALFQEHCAVCHGKSGHGDGPAANSLQTRPANFHDLGHSSMYTPGEKFWIITHGTSETGMPEFGGMLSDDERWGLVNYILWLQRAE
jgi:mono/diheme cytochrome c family protein